MIPSFSDAIADLLTFRQEGFNEFRKSPNARINKVMIVLQWFVPEGFRSLFALVGTNGQGVGTRFDRLSHPSHQILNNTSPPGS